MHEEHKPWSMKLTLTQVGTIYTHTKQNYLFLNYVAFWLGRLMTSYYKTTKVQINTPHREVDEHLKGNERSEVDKKDLL